MSERSVGLTLVEYVVSASCANAGPDALGVAALVLSTSPDTTVVDDEIRCGPVASQSAVATLDTCTLRQERCDQKNHHHRKNLSHEPTFSV